MPIEGNHARLLQGFKNKPPKGYYVLHLLGPLQFTRLYCIYCRPSMIGLCTARPNALEFPCDTRRSRWDCTTSGRETSKSFRGRDEVVLEPRSEHGLFVMGQMSFAGRVLSMRSFWREPKSSNGAEHIDGYYEGFIEVSTKQEPRSQRLVATYPSTGGRREAHGCVFQGRKAHGVTTNVYSGKMLEKP
ncbi:hypothetical protein HKD37_06G017247 [Glycine soja]